MECWTASRTIATYAVWSTHKEQEKPLFKLAQNDIYTLQYIGAIVPSTLPGYSMLWSHANLKKVTRWSHANSKESLEQWL